MSAEKSLAKNTEGIEVREGKYGPRFYLRVKVDGKWTRRRLEAHSAKQAKEVAKMLRAEEFKARKGLIRDPHEIGMTVAELIDLFLAEGCPDKRLQKRSASAQEIRKHELARPKEFFGKFSARKLRLPDVALYGDWAIPRMKKVCNRPDAGMRTADMELTSLSAVFNWARVKGLVDINPCHGRPKLQKEEHVRHAREVCPASADELHAIAKMLMEDPRSEVLAWQCLFQALTGCRTNEILALRMDANNEEAPGFISQGFLFVRREKGGIYPYIKIHPVLNDLIRAHHHWHSVRFPNNPWWFPGRVDDGISLINDSSLSHALHRICRELGIPHRTAHGMRSYYITARRGALVESWQISAEIGNKTEDLIQRTYGGLPATYRGGNLHTWLPANGDPAWSIWLPPDNGVLQMPKPQTA